MADRVTVACPAGHAVTTVVRGRSTTCAKCKRRVFIRIDGTSRHQPVNEGRGELAASSPPDAESFRWGRRYDADPGGWSDYDPVADRTKLYADDASGTYLGWMQGDARPEAEDE